MENCLGLPGDAFVHVTKAHAVAHALIVESQVDEAHETPQEALTRILAQHPDQQSELRPRPH